MYYDLDFSWFPFALVMAGVGCLAVIAGLVIGAVWLLSHIQIVIV